MPINLDDLKLIVAAFIAGFICYWIYRGVVSIALHCMAEWLREYYYKELTKVYVGKFNKRTNIDEMAEDIYELNRKVRELTEVKQESSGS